MQTTSGDKLPTRFAFLLVNDFTLISMSSAIEPLRMANRICGSDIYTWKTISESGGAVSASDGLSVNVDCGIDDNNALDDMDAIIVCGGWDIEKNTTDAVLRFLRMASKAGVGLGSICTGSFILARAGLLEGFRCSVHWENMGALADLFPKVHVSRNVFTIEGNRYTCSGGTSPIDMMLHFIKQHCGPEVSAGVAAGMQVVAINSPYVEESDLFEATHILDSYAQAMDWLAGWR